MDYKKFSLESLSNWISDCITSSDATPQEIYSAVIDGIREEYKIYKKFSDKSYELLSLFEKTDSTLLSSSNTDTISFDGWESHYYPEEYSNSLQYTEEELNAMCDHAEKQQQELSVDGKTLSYSEAIAAGWKMTDDGFWYKDQEQYSKKWTLPVEVDGASGEYYLQLPDDLLDKLNWKEGDTLEYISNSDGSFIVKKCD